VLSTGQYPDAFLETIDRTNKREKIRMNRVEQFTKEEQELIKGIYDTSKLHFTKHKYTYKLQYTAFKNILRELNHVLIDEQHGFRHDILSIFIADNFETGHQIDFITAYTNNYTKAFESKRQKSILIY